MSKHAKQLLLACALPVLILLGMTAIPLYTLFYGDEIILQTVPVDPSDVFRGDYVQLRYEAEEVPKSMVEKEIISEAEKGRFDQKVYVILKEENGIYSPVKVTLNKPKKEIYLKGKLQYLGKDDGFEEKAFIDYSLDKYFLEDNTGLDWEHASAQGEILAKVKVKNGYAYLVDIEKK